MAPECHWPRIRPWNRFRAINSDPGYSAVSNSLVLGPGYVTDTGSPGFSKNVQSNTKVSHPLTQGFV